MSSILSTMIQSCSDRSSALADRQPAGEQVLRLKNPYDLDDSNDCRKRLVLGIGGFGSETIHTLNITCNAEALRNLDLVACDMAYQQLNYYSDVYGVLATGDLGGLGAGGEPRRAVYTIEQNLPRFEKLIKDRESVILTCGMGGGFGSAGIVVFSELCSCLKINTEAYISMPEKHEGAKRNSQAEEYLRLLKKFIPDGRIHITTTRDLAVVLSKALEKTDNLYGDR